MAYAFPPDLARESVDPAAARTAFRSDNRCFIVDDATLREPLQSETVDHTSAFLFHVFRHYPDSRIFHI